MHQIRDDYPGQVTFFVGTGRTDNFVLYGLFKDRHFLIVQVKMSVPGDDTTILYELSSIQTVLDSIEFGRSNWAYLLQQRDGTTRILYRDKPSFITRCPIWLPLVREDDIEITRWIGIESREGIYRGQEVDLLMGWDPRCAGIVLKESEGQKKMHELGLGHLCFRALAHIVSYSGEVVGLMQEPCYGRMVEYRDRPAVYEAVLTMQRHGIVHRGVGKSHIMMTDQGIRFLCMSSIHHFGKDEMQELEEEAQVYYWDKLERLFESLKQGERGDPTTRYFESTAFVIPRLPSPLRPVKPSIEDLVFALLMKNPDDFLEKAMSKWRRRREAAIVKLVASANNSSHYASLPEPGHDAPWGATCRPLRPRSRPLYHPYSASLNTRLIAPDCSEFGSNGSSIYEVQ